MNPADLIDYAKSLDCIHCGLCLRTCPTYQLTGVESSSPRGRIHLMRAVAEGRLEADAEYAEELDFCLVCRNCESACPSGVQFGSMMETARDGLEHERKRPVLARLARHIGFRWILPHRWALSSAAFGLRLAQRTGLVRLIGKLFGERGRALAAQPAVPPRRERQRLPAVTPAGDKAQTRGAVDLLQGCVMPEWLGRVNRATVRVLSEAGYDSHVPPKHVCCGALHAHNGDIEGAKDLLKRTIESFEGSDEARPLVVNSAGCGAHLREAEHFFENEPEWRERASALANRVRDFSEFLSEEKAHLHLRASPELRQPITYDDPCHLCHGQGVRTPPREWLDQIQGAERVPLEESESCCGSAGIYSILRPSDSRAILDPKLKAAKKSGARTLVTANPGCQLQWQAGVTAAGLDLEVLHLAEALERSLVGKHHVE